MKVVPAPPLGPGFAPGGSACRWQCWLPALTPSPCYNSCSRWTGFARRRLPLSPARNPRPVAESAAGSHRSADFRAGVAELTTGTGLSSVSVYEVVDDGTRSGKSRKQSRVGVRRHRSEAEYRRHRCCSKFAELYPLGVIVPGPLQRPSSPPDGPSIYDVVRSSRDPELRVCRIVVPSGRWQLWSA